MTTVKVAVGETITSPWWHGGFPITQLWGPTDYGGEPPGHGYAHWHAGLDIGLSCGTEIWFPQALGQFAIAVPFDNPGGYGTALKLQMSQGGRTGSVRTVDIVLGHLMSRHVTNGQMLRGGEMIAISNNTGNSSGCHLHFEVRPPDGSYGTDVDPSQWLLAGQGQAVAGSSGSTGTTSNDPTDPNGVNPFNPVTQAPQWFTWEEQHAQAPLTAGITQFTNTLEAQGEALLGVLALGTGAVILAFGMRGKGLGQAHQATTGRLVRTVRRGQAAGRQRTEAEGRAEDRELRSAERQGQANERFYRQDTMRLYRNGLIGQAEAQRRLGEPVRRVGSRGGPGPAGRNPLRPTHRRRTGRRSLSGDLEREAARRAAEQTRMRPNLREDDIPF